MSSFCRLLTAAALAAVVVVPAAAQQPEVRVEDDEITIRGCVGNIDPTQRPDEKLVWTRGDIMLAHAMTVADESVAVGTTGVPGPFFYWLEDDEDLSQHVGQLVEVKGELGDFEEGEVTFEQDGEFTEIELDLDGEKETTRVPTAWLGPAARDQDRQFDIVVRKIDVEDVRVLGVCDR